MADPFGIVGVIGVASQIARQVVTLGLDWKDAPADTRRFMAEIQALRTVLSETHASILVDADFKNAFIGKNSALLAQLGGTTQPTDTSVMVSACKQDLESLLDGLKKGAQGHRIGWERIKGAFLAKRTRESVENLQRQCQTLNNLVALDTLALGVHIHKEVTEARKEHQAWQTDRENQAVLDWITTVDYSTQQSDFIGRHQPGTGQWLLDSEEYRQWTATAKEALFCPGIPGAGKTILASVVVNNLQGHFGDDVGIAYLFCNFRRHTEQKAQDLLSSLLRQLSQDQAALPECVRSLYDKHKGKTRPSIDELSGALQAVASLFLRVFIIVDALDECQLSDGSRVHFLREVFALQNSSGANIFATSRANPEITEIFKEGLSLEIRAHPADVRRYLEGNMSNLPLCVARSPELQEDIITKIVETVDGMFLLAQLHLDSLKGKSAPKTVRAALKTLYTGNKAYDRAYNDAMQRISGQLPDQEQLAKRVLSWITCAMRPLSTTELQHALCVEPGETKLDPDNMPLAEDLVSVCAGLVTVDQDSGIIRLVHYTTQEYLMRTWQTWFPNAQVEITEICATYLSFSAFESGFCPTDAEFEDRLRLNPLYDYAAHYWGHHARKAGGEAIPAVVNVLMSKRHVEAQVQAMTVTKSRYPYSQDFPRQMQGLHVASYFGMQGATKKLLGSIDNPDTRDSYGRTPLSLAVRNGRDAVVKILLDTGKVDVDSRDTYSQQTPLSWAARNGHDTVVKTLLETGNVDVESKDLHSDQTLLSWAARKGRETVVKMLLDTGKVDVESKDLHSDQTLLSWAARKGREAVVKMLLDTGKVDVNSKDAHWGHTPLSWAASEGYDVVVKMLLETGKVQVESTDAECGQTPVIWAARKGHHRVVKMLLETGKAKVDSKDTRYGQTPVMWAARNRHHVVVKMLLDIGQALFDNVEPFSACPLLAIFEGGTAILPVGKAQGVCIGSEFAAVGTSTGFGVLVTHVEDFACRASISFTTEQAAAAHIPSSHSCHVVPSRWSFGDQALNVLIGPGFPSMFQESLSTCLQRRIASSVNVEMEKAAGQDDNSIRIALVQGDVHIRGPERWIGYNSVIPCLGLRVEPHDELAAKTASRICHLARFKQVLDLKDLENSESRPFNVTLNALCDTPYPGPFPNGHTHIFNFRNSSDASLFVAAFSVTPGFSIRYMYLPWMPSQCVEGGDTFSFRFQTSIPENFVSAGFSGSLPVYHRDIIRTVVTAQAQKASWITALELPQVWDAGQLQPLESMIRESDSSVGLDSRWWVQDCEIHTFSS